MQITWKISGYIIYSGFFNKVIFIETEHHLSSLASKQISPGKISAEKLLII